MDRELTPAERERFAQYLEFEAVHSRRRAASIATVGGPAARLRAAAEAMAAHVIARKLRSMITEPAAGDPGVKT